MSAPTHLAIEYVNVTEGYRFGNENVKLGDNYDEANIERVEDIYAHGLGEYGRCTGKVYVDTANGVLHVGYVFQKRVQYDDCTDTYVREVWASLVHIEPRRVTAATFEAVAS